jgi:hypothetical protein
MDKNHSSELIKKKVRWLTPNKIREQVVGSNHSKSESDAMTAEEEFYLQVETGTYLYDSVPPRRVVIRNAPVVVVMKQRKRVGHIDRPLQPCGGQCPVALEIVWYTHAKGA